MILIESLKSQSWQLKNQHLDLSRHLDLDCSRLSRPPGLLLTIFITTILYQDRCLRYVDSLSVKWIVRQLKKKYKHYQFLLTTFWTLKTKCGRLRALGKIVQFGKASLIISNEICASIWHCSLILRSYDLKKTNTNMGVIFNIPNVIN